MSLAPKTRKAWREGEDSSPLAALDFLGVRHFIYGGNPEWVRRRWFMLMSLVIGFLSAVVACVTTAMGLLSEDLAKTVVSRFFALVMVVVPGYVLGAVWDKKNQMESGTMVTETTVREAGPPATETTTKQVAPAPTDPE